MLTCYVTAEEFRTFYNVGTMAKDANILTALRAATYEIEGTLRGRGYDTASLQPPEMFDTLPAYQAVTKTASYTSASLAAEGTRFVVDVIDGTGTFLLEGSPDGIAWYPVKGADDSQISISVSTPATMSALILQRFPNYRYSVSTTDCNYRAYIVDGGPDRAIRALACHLCMFPFADKDSTIDRIDMKAMDDYREAMDSLNLLMAVNVDKDGDGDPDDTIGNAYVRRSVRMFR